ncbi:peptidoglycan DD-metalloendopeptidase family protein [uncultured Algibacter sp.]|uniref:peptidoglycan DD-metalloendopeptidase family protein n=1 Tax=uncultured Algibacter sp. TaxID=298659 RepID=UPI0026137AE8|nr:peptidoglycan DD-metalloendopeptidase family protein [uncultured Algibacter sp.]
MNFSNVLFKLNNSPIRVIDASINTSKYVPLDLSETNENLNKIDVSSALKLGGYVNNFISKHKAEVAYGGYLEVRNIYKRSSHFNNQAKEERNIHLGVDIWCAAKKPIFAPLEGIVHSFKNNTNYGDYGPTIILKHTIKGYEFYTLYGHLSLDSIANLKVGTLIKQGEKMAALGDASVNGNYPPHLHFQIIRDIQDYVGDYPGVCSKTDLMFYKNNCPDPNLLLKLQ